MLLHIKKISPDKRTIIFTNAVKVATKISPMGAGGEIGENSSYNSMLTVLCIVIA